MTVTQAKRIAPPQERDWRDDGLVLAATRLLRAGDAPRAFELIDRRCRLDQAPSPSERAVRALAGRLCGWPFWREDLEAAHRADPLDAMVNAARLALGEPAERLGAARGLVAALDMPRHALRDAIACLLQAGEAALRLDLVDGRLSGLVAWRGDAPAVLEIEGTGRSLGLALTGDLTLGFVPPGAQAVTVEADLPFERAHGYTLRIGETAVAAGPLHPRSRRGGETSPDLRAPFEIPARAALVVVVPVFDDFAATQDCLRAAVAEVARHPGTRLVVVDDASPVPKLKLLLDALAGRDMIELKRNAANLGFAGAVQRGLENAGGRDALILNADAILPEGALARLMDAAYGAADIGTVTPLSNNGEYTSFPLPGIDNSAPSREDFRRIDAAAARANAGIVVDLPTGTGFCLYLRHDARAAAGDMPGIYGRGYFEDMELCLRAHERAFRNVCAADVYVLHHGGRSFGAEKRALVARNLRILRGRFPGITEICAAHVAADPLARARGAIEAALPPPTGLPLLLAREGAALLPDRLAAHGGAAMRLLWSDRSGARKVRLLGPNGAAPQSLRFDPENEALSAYLSMAAPTGVELVGTEPPPQALVGILAGLGVPFDLVLGDGVPGAPLLPAPEGFAPRRILACERQSLAMLQAAALPAGVEIVDARPATSAQTLTCRPNAPVSLGFLAPAPIAACDAFLRALSTALRRRLPQARILVLGRTLDDAAMMARGNVFVSGPVPRGEEAAILSIAGVQALVLPPASLFSADAERLAGRFGLPLAMADLTGGRLVALSPSLLLLEPEARDAGNAGAIVDWFADRLETSPA